MVKSGPSSGIYVPTFSNVTVLNLGPVVGGWDSYISVAGHVAPDADVSGYTVNVNGAKLNLLYGAQSVTKNATDNHVKVSDGDVNISAVGGRSETGDAIKNGVEIEGGTVTGYFAIAVVGVTGRTGTTINTAGYRAAADSNFVIVSVTCT